MQDNEVDKEDSNISKHSTGLSLQENENKNHFDIVKSPLIFVAHPSEPTTSTPLQVSFLVHPEKIHFINSIALICKLFRPLHLWVYHVSIKISLNLPRMDS